MAFGASLLDTLATPRNKEAAPALRDRGCGVLCLPPCSPGLNPIEQAFSKPISEELVRVYSRPSSRQLEKSGEIRDLYEPIERWNDFKADRYVSN